MIGYSKHYELEVGIDFYGSNIHKGELYAIDYYYGVGEVIHLENICDWLNEKYDDYEAEMINDDADFIEYIVQKYDIEVYKK